MTPSVPSIDDITDSFRRPPDQWLDVGHGQLAHRRFGDGPDVLFVHGWPVSGATFRGLVQHLAPHVTCHVVDLVGAGDSRFDRSLRLSLESHVAGVRRALDVLELEDVAVVAHDSGGLIARHAFAGDPRLRAMGLIGTEQLTVSPLFRAFLTAGRAPGFDHALAWLSGRPHVRRSDLVLGGCFTDGSLLDGAFDELFLAPLRDDPDRRWAAGQLIRGFDTSWIDDLAAVHARLDVPVRLVWGADDPFFPVEETRRMLPTFPDATLDVIEDARLFVHEEKPAEVAASLLPTLTA